MSEKAHCSYISRHDIEELVAGRFNQAPMRKGQIESHIKACTVCEERLKEAQKHQGTGRKRGILGRIPFLGR